MSEGANGDTTTTGLATTVPGSEDVIQEQGPGQDATDDLGVHDRLAPPMIQSNNAVYADSQILSAETQSSRRILFRIPRTSVLDLENSYLAYQVEADLPSTISSRFWRQAFPALVGGASAIDHVVVRIGQQEVQRIDDFAWWMGVHAPQLTMNQQQFVRSHLDLSGTAYGADSFGNVTNGRNPFAMELGDLAPPGRTKTSNSRQNKLEYVYQIFGRSVQSHVTIPLMALCPSLFNSIRLYPAMAAEQLSIELVLSDKPSSLLSTGAAVLEDRLTHDRDTITTSSNMNLEATPSGYDDIPSFKITDPIIMADFLTMPKPILDVINNQVQQGLSRYAYTRIIKKQLHIKAEDGNSTKDAPIRADNSILTNMIFLRKKKSAAQTGGTRLGAYETCSPFSELNLNLNNNNYFEKTLHDGIDFQQQTSRLMDEYYVPSVVYDSRTHEVSTKNSSAAHMGLFSPVGIDFLLEANISRQPILVRHKARAAPASPSISTTFQDNVDVWLGRAESLILSSSRSRVL